MTNPLHISLQLTVEVPKPFQSEVDAISKNVVWPVVPRVGDELDLCNLGYAGGHIGVVARVVHWLGYAPGSEGAIQVFLRLEPANSEGFLSGWKDLVDDGWKTR